MTDDSLEPPQLLAAVGGLLAAGIRVVQFRDKRHSDRERAGIGRDLLEMVHRAGGLLIVNDRADLAIAIDADGVHLGQDDLPVAIGRRLLGAGRVIGASASYLPEIHEAETGGADYLGFGAVYPTGTKLDAELAGLELFEQACQVATVPVVGIGGITADRAPGVLARGALGVAVVSALFRAPDPEEAARQLLAAVGG